MALIRESATSGELRKFEKLSCRALRQKYNRLRHRTILTPRGMAGPILLASILVDKYHLSHPARPSEQAFREGGC